jgi:hypothetical protein
MLMMAMVMYTLIVILIIIYLFSVELFSIEMFANSMNKSDAYKIWLKQNEANLRGVDVNNFKFYYSRAPDNTYQFEQNELQPQTPYTHADHIDTQIIVATDDKYKSRRKRQLALPQKMYRRNLNSKKD